MDFTVQEVVNIEDAEIPPVLYKYRNWNDPNHKRIITHREVFYASPSSFEDKFDCRNPVRYDLLTENDIMDYFFQDSLDHNKNFTHDQHLDYINEHVLKTEIRDLEFIKKSQEDFFKLYNIRSGILSLTEYPLEVEMWKIYSNSHTGFCIGFDGNELFKNIKGGGGKVIYQPELPLVHPNHKHIERMILMIQFKLEHYSFEKEYRARIFQYEPLTIKDRTKIIPPKAFKEIILGAYMSEIDINDLINSIPKELEHIKIKKAQIIDESIIISNYEH